MGRRYQANRRAKAKAHKANQQIAAHRRKGPDPTPERIETAPAVAVPAAVPAAVPTAVPAAGPAPAPALDPASRPVYLSPEELATLGEALTHLLLEVLDQCRLGMDDYEDVEDDDYYDEVEDDFEDDDEDLEPTDRP